MREVLVMIPLGPCFHVNQECGNVKLQHLTFKQ